MQTLFDDDEPQGEGPPLLHRLEMVVAGLDAPSRGERTFSFEGVGVAGVSPDRDQEVDDATLDHFVKLDLFLLAGAAQHARSGRQKPHQVRVLDAMAFDVRAVGNQVRHELRRQQRA